MAEQQQGSLEAVLGRLDKKYGMTVAANWNSVVKGITVVSTGIKDVDEALGCGGLVQGRITEIYGAESSGKTTFALMMAGRAQKQTGLPVLFVDFEHSLDLNYAKALGVDTDKNMFILVQPEYLELGFDIMREFAREGCVGCTILDTIAAAMPKSELEGELIDAEMGKHSRAISKALRMLTHDVHQSNQLALFINQTRTGGLGFRSYETTTGGRALKYYASMRISVKVEKPVKRGDALYANETLFKVVKNKMAVPYKEARLWLVMGKGFYRAHPRELLDAVQKEQSA